MAGLETVYAVHNFEAENHDEIAFKVGEPIIVLEKDEEYKDGWWQVCCHKLLCQFHPNPTSILTI
jgi:hypothetical protein